MTGAGERKDTEVKKSEVDFMDIKILDTKENQVKFLVKGTNPAFANALRRTMMAGLNILALEDVHFYQNTSVMFDEMLAHRLAMIPLKMDSKKYKAGEKVKMILEKEGPCTVYSKDIKSTDPKIDVIDKKIPIVKLKKGKKIKIEMEAVVGKGKAHAKWQPAVISYYEVPEVSFNMKLIKDAKKFVESCPPGVLELKAGKIVLKEQVPSNIDLLTKCRDIAPDGAVELNFDTNSFVVVVENHGNMKVSEILSEALDSLKERSKEFKRELKKI